MTAIAAGRQGPGHLKRSRDVLDEVIDTASDAHPEQTPNAL